MTAPQDQRRADEGRLAAQIGELLRAERHRARLSQAALARAAGTAQQCVSQLETGRYAPTTAVVERLFAALDCQLRLDIEPRDADLDGLITSAGEQPADDVDAALDGLRALARTAGDLEYLLDGELAARLHGVPVIVRPAYPIAVAEADLDGLAAWICAVPNCRRYSERWRDFSDYDVDPTRPVPGRCGGGPRSASWRCGCCRGCRSRSRCRSGSGRCGCVRCPRSSATTRRSPACCAGCVQHPTPQHHESGGQQHGERGE